MALKRFLSEYGIYHIYNRGHNKMKILRDKQDNTVFLNTIRQVQLIYNFRIFAWCLMRNHYHLLIKDVKKYLPDAIGLIQERYAIYYNAKYKHSGAVFMKPFKSKPVFSRGHFFLLIGYILNNPVKAGMTYEYNDYLWSSPIIGYEKYNITDYLYVNHYYKSVGGLTLDEYIRQLSSSRIISDLELESLSDEEARELFYKIVKDQSNLSEFSLEVITKETLVNIVSEANYLGISLRQISDFTSLEKSKLSRIKKEKEYI